MIKLIITQLVIILLGGIAIAMLASYLTWIQNDLNCSHRWGQNPSYHNCMLRQFPYWDNSLSGVPYQ